MTTICPDWPEPNSPRAPVLVLAPHPDDEVLGCSRLMQRVSGSGGALVIVWLTDGGGSHGPLPADEHENLVRRRQAEARAGVQALGVVPQALHFLDYPDGYLAEHIAAAGSAVAAICRRHGIHTVAVTDKNDGHPDHRAAYAIAMRLSVPQVLSYPISTRFDGHAYAPPATTLAIAPDANGGKRRALLQHASQMEASALYPLTPAAIARFCTEPEFFLPVRTTIDAA
jgi:LmbE family N-acetylglucosaminyl deacetylase